MGRVWFAPTILLAAFWSYGIMLCQCRRIWRRDVLQRDAVRACARGSYQEAYRSAEV